jgi:hypothetical protein
MVTVVTLLALPATPENWWRAAIATGADLPGDDTYLRDDDGGILARCSGPKRHALRMLIYAERNHLEIGPADSVHADAAFAIWATPVQVTRALILATADIVDGLDRGAVGSWLSARVGMIVWAEHW